MALPPKGDPRRPLHLAARSTRSFAVIFLALSSCTVFPIFLGHGGAMNSAAYASGMVIFLVGPGAGYLACSIYLRKRKRWAIILALTLSSIQTLYLSIAMLGFAIAFFAMGRPGRQYVPSFLIILPIVVGLLLVAMGQMIYHLIRSFDAVQYASWEEDHGFAPNMSEAITSEAITPGAPPPLPPMATVAPVTIVPAPIVPDEPPA